MLVRNVLRMMRSRLRPRRPRPVVLMYHRVASVRHDPWGLAVGPDHFENQIAYLKKHRRPMSMNELVDRLRTKTLPANAVAITFDDGYRDNLLKAKPVLQKYGVPATLFLATGCVDGTVPFWWDELGAMILESARPARLIEVCAGKAIALSWELPEPSDIAGTWRAANGPRTARQHCYLAMWRSLQLATGQERDRVMRSLRQSFGTHADPLAMPMSTDEVHALLSGDILKLGAHAVTHPALTSLSRSERRREIGDSARSCRVLSGRPIDGFAYPYGDIDSETRRDVKGEGFEWACSTRSAFLDDEHPDLYALPRITVPDVPVRLFRAMMAR